MGKEGNFPHFVVALTVVEGFAFVGLGTTIRVGQGLTALDVLLGLAAVLTVLATVKLAGRRSSRRRAASRRAAASLPAMVIPLAELAVRIGARALTQEPVQVATEPLAPGADGSADTVTGLIGLAALAAGAATSIELGHSCAVIVFDVDAFTDQGEPGDLPDDLAAQVVATALWSNLRREDLAARYGGDRFVVFLDRCERVEAERVMARVTKSVGNLSTAVGRPVGLAAGIATSSGGYDLYGLIDLADPQRRQGRRASGWLPRPA